MRSSLPAFLTVAACLATCASPPLATTPVPEPHTPGPMLLSVVGRHQSITVRHSPDGPLYTVTGDHGQPLAANLTEPELQSLHPDLYHQIQSYTADLVIPGPRFLCDER